MSKQCARKNDSKMKKRPVKSKKESDMKKLRLNELEPSQISRQPQLESIAIGLAMLVRKSSLCLNRQDSRHKRELSLRMNQRRPGVQNSELEAN